MATRFAMITTLMFGSACNSWPALYSVKNPGRRVEPVPSPEITQMNSKPLRQTTETSAEVSHELENPLSTNVLELSRGDTSSLTEVTEPALVETVSAKENKADDLTMSTNVPVNSVALASSQVEVKKTVPKSAHAARLVISGVRPSRGNVKVAIYTVASSFPNPAGASQTFELASTNPTLETSLPSIRQFAVAVYQDINSDGELNRNRFGIPTEPFAFSNNAMGKRGPPSFEQAVVVQPTEAELGVNEPLVVSVQLP